MLYVKRANRRKNEKTYLTSLYVQKFINYRKKGVGYV
jgi:hypothetical protein